MWLCGFVVVNVILLGCVGRMMLGCRLILCLVSGIGMILLICVMLDVVILVSWCFLCLVVIVFGW